MPSIATKDGCGCICSALPRDATYRHAGRNRIGSATCWNRGAQSAFAIKLKQFGSC